MKHIFVFLSFMAAAAAFLMAPPAFADKDELYGRWYAGDWVSETVNLDRQQVVYGLRIARSNSILGCIIYPNKDETDRKLFGQIIDTGANDLEIRLSNGQEIELKKIGRAPNNRLKIIKVDERRVQAEFHKQFLPANCI